MLNVFRKKQTLVKIVLPKYLVLEAGRNQTDADQRAQRRRSAASKSG